MCPTTTRVALITGASSGIGAAAARLFAKKGCDVVLTGRNETALASVVEEIAIASPAAKAKYLVGDICKDEDCANIVASTGRMDVLVNCAGVLQSGAVGQANMSNFDFNMNTNVRAIFCLITNAVPFLERSESGSLTTAIVNVSSVNGLQSFGGIASYCVSKAACDMLTNVAAVDLAPKHIRVNSVNPGVVITDLQKRGGMGEEAYQAFLKRSCEVTHPLGRVATAEEVADAIWFLSDSTTSDFITGTHLTVDGGRTCLGSR